MTDDELRAEVNALIASGENGEGAAIETDILWAAFDKFWNARGGRYMSLTVNSATEQGLRDVLGAAFEAGWDAYADEFKGNKAQSLSPAEGDASSGSADRRE